MPAYSPLTLTLGFAALLAAGATPAQARRAAESLPQPAPLSAAARFAALAPAPAQMRAEDRAPAERSRFGGREEYGTRAHSDRHDDQHSGGPRGGHEFEEAEDHESHHIGHHGHDDSPGC